MTQSVALGRRFLAVALALAGPSIVFSFFNAHAHERGGQRPAQQLEADCAGLGKYAIPEKPWLEVLQWLADKTGLGIATEQLPRGVFRYPVIYQPPTDMGEVFGILNDALSSQELVLIPRSLTIAVWPRQKPWPSARPLYITGMPRSVNVWDVAELKKAAAGEFGIVIFRFKRIRSEQAVALLQKTMGVVGRAFPFDTPNLLVLIDQAENLREAVRRLQAMDGITVRVPMPWQSWKDALDWLSESTGLPFAGGVIPTKPLLPFVYQGDEIAMVGAVIDHLNRQLADQQLLIVRGERAIHVVFTDEWIDPALVPRVRWADLQERGKSEVVSVAVAFSGVKAGEMKAVVGKMLSRVGRVWEAPCNQLVVQDKTEVVRRVLALVRARGP